MVFGAEMISQVVQKIISKELRYEDSIVIGDNSSGKSELLRRLVLELIKTGQVIDMDGKIPNYEYNNLVVQLFAMQIEAKTIEERLKICSSIYPILVLAGE